MARRVLMLDTPAGDLEDLALRTRLISPDELSAADRARIQPHTILVAAGDDAWGQLRLKVRGANIPIDDTVAAEALALLQAERRLLIDQLCEELLRSGRAPRFATREEAIAHRNRLERDAAVRGEERPSASLVDFEGLVGVVLTSLYQEHPRYVALSKRIWTLRMRLFEGQPAATIAGVRWFPWGE